MYSCIQVNSIQKLHNSSVNPQSPKYFMKKVSITITDIVAPGMLLD